MTKFMLPQKVELIQFLGVKNITIIHKEKIQKKADKCRPFFFVGSTGFEPVTLPMQNRDALNQCRKS